MNMYELIMNDQKLRKQVLIEFGFGTVNPIKVEKWVKKHYPSSFNQLRKNAVQEKIVQLEREATTAEYRTKLIDNVFGKQ